MTGLTNRCSELRKRSRAGGLAASVPHFDSSFPMTQPPAFPSMSRLPSSLHSTCPRATPKAAKAPRAILRLPAQCLNQQNRPQPGEVQVLPPFSIASFGAIQYTPNRAAFPQSKPRNSRNRRTFVQFSLGLFCDARPRNDISVAVYGGARVGAAAPTPVLARDISRVFCSLPSAFPGVKQFSRLSSVCLALQLRFSFLLASLRPSWQCAEFAHFGCARSRLRIKGPTYSVFSRNKCLGLYLPALRCYSPSLFPLRGSRSCS